MTVVNCFLYPFGFEIMLQQLPLEIILNICTHLSFEEKLNIKLTCHKLNDLFTNAILYETLDLLKPKYKAKIDRDNDDDSNERDRPYDAIIRRLAYSQFDGSLVRVLRLDTSGLSDDVFSLLSDLFPNLTRLIVPTERGSMYSSHDDIRYDFFDIVNPLLKWRNTINTIISLNDWPQLVKDLFSSPYTQLTKLDLHDVKDKLVKCIGNKNSSFFENAPLLNTLTLRNATISLGVFEAMHDGFPRLRILKLISPYMKISNNTVLPTTIVPANLLTNLVILRATGITRNGVILNYMPNKYPNLEQLLFSVDRSDDYAIIGPGEAKVKTNIWSSGEEEDDEKSIAIKTSRRAIESNFFSSLPSSLNTLALDMNNIDNAVVALAESDTKIKTLDLIQIEIKDNYMYSIGLKKIRNRLWKDATMLEHVKNLTSLRTLKVGFGSSVLSFNGDFISSTVTSLSLGIDTKLFYIDWILGKFPSLEELHINPPRCNTMRIKECELKIQQDDEIGNDDIMKTKSKIQYPKLRTFSIRACRLQPDFFDFIKFAAPNLDELSLTVDSKSSESRKNTFKYDLSNWSLSKCNVLVSSNESCLCFIVTIRNVSKTFAIQKEKNSLIPVEKLSGQSHSRMWIEIIADDIKDFNVLGYSIVKVGNKLIILL